MELQILDRNGSKAEFYNGKYRVFDTYEYMFRDKKRLSNECAVLNGIIDDMTGSDKIVCLNKDPEAHFVNCLGTFSISTTDGNILADIDVVTNKVNEREAHELFEYVYEKNNLLFETYLTRLKDYNVENVEVRNKELPVTRYLEVIKDYIASLEFNYRFFRTKTSYKLTHDVKKIDYNEKCVTDKSIEWILTNLDELHFDKNLKHHPDSVQIGHDYALILKILQELPKKNYDLYENQIIRGSINKLGRCIREIKEEIELYFEGEPFFSDKFASFESLKRTVLKSELNQINKLSTSYKNIGSIYTNLLSTVKPLEKRPKMTHLFKSERHYRNLFQRIQNLFHSSLDNTGMLLVLGIRNLDELYELYNLYVIVDIFERHFGVANVRYHGDKLDHVSFKTKNNCVYRIFYQLPIRTKEDGPRYPWIKLFSNTSLNTHYTPDIVIEREKRDTFNYAIFDAKFSSKGWVTGDTAHKIVGKYYFSISFLNEPYKKIDYLHLLYPNHGVPYKFTKNEGYYPEISSIPSLPSNNSHLLSHIENIISAWER